MTVDPKSYEQSGKQLQAQQRNPQRELAEQRKQWYMAQPRLDALADFIRGGLDPRALTRFLLQDLTVNPTLAACTPESLFLGLLACAMTGLEPGPLKGHAYLVPYGKDATFIAGYKGIIVQARRSRAVVGLTANVVHTNDTFDVDLGTSNRLIHKPLLRGDRGPVIGAYAIAQLQFGSRDVIDIDEQGRVQRGVASEIEWMDIDELNKIKKAAKGTSRADSPWNAWESEMQRKSVIRRLGKRLPLGDDYFRGLALDRAHDDNRIDDIAREQRKFIDIETEGKASKIVDAPAPPAPDGALTADEKAEIARAEADEVSRGR